MTVCAHAQRLIPLLYDGELDGPLRREMNGHVVECTACIRVLTRLDRGQELLRQAIDEQIADIDFTAFWQGVEGKLSDRPLLRPARLRLWWNSWRPLWSWRAPVWAAATVALLAGGATTVWQLQPAKPSPNKPMLLAGNDQAQIESLSASDTVWVWNEPTSNATVIWVGDEGEGELP